MEPLRPIAVAIVLITLVTPGHARQHVEFDNAKDLAGWMTSYYQHPEPDRIVEAMRAASRFGLLRGTNTAPPMFGFLAGWFLDNDAATDAVIDKLADLPPEDLPAVIAGLWYSGAPGSIPALKKYASRMPSQQAVIAERVARRSQGIAAVPLENGAWAVDALWGNFSATGKDAPVVRIMTALPWTTLKQSDKRRLVGEAARWSLTSNAVQHPRVLAICREQLKQQPKDVAKVLAEVIKQAEAELNKGGAR